MINKIVETVDGAVEDIWDGSVVLIGGWGGIGVPLQLIGGLLRKGARDLVMVSNNCGMGVEGDQGILFRYGRIRKVCASYPTRPGARDFMDAVERGECTLELIPQGTLAERLRAAGAGLGGFYTPAGVGTVVAEGREVREIDGRRYLFEPALHGDFALIRARYGDRHGNLRYRYTSRNFNPVMAMAASVTIAEVEELVPVGSIDPDDVHTPGIFVDRVVVVGRYG